MDEIDQLPAILMSTSEPGSEDPSQYWWTFLDEPWRERRNKFLPMMMFTKPCMILTSKALNFLIFLICFSGFLFLLQCPSWKHRCFGTVFLLRFLARSWWRQELSGDEELHQWFSGSWMNSGQETGESHFCWDRFGQMTFFLNTFLLIFLDS